MVLSADFIFVDINMPKLSGVECLKELRKIDELSDADYNVLCLMPARQFTQFHSSQAGTFALPHIRHSAKAMQKSLPLPPATPKQNQN